MNFRNEIARRYTLRDWIVSSKTRRLIGQINPDLLISELIKDGKPALVGRLGGTEGRFIGEYLKMKRYEKLGIPIAISSKFNYRWRKRVPEIRLNAGFSASGWGEIEEFVKLYLECLRDTDVIGAWGTAFAWAETLAFTPENNPFVISIGSTAPWIEPIIQKEYPKPWSRQLEGKKVLIIAGFAESIEKQYHRRAQIFPANVYPEFSLSTIRAPLSAGRFSERPDDWHESLNLMKKLMEDSDFDIALVSAGAYSYPLALKAKQMGKIGIHCGGGLQLFFGIMGGRWDHDLHVLSKQNEFWVRPSKSETPENAEGVEGGCYW